MLPQQILAWSVDAALALLAVSFVLTTLRVVVGPTLPDRVLALDTLVSTAIGFMAVFAIKTGYPLYIDIAIALGLVGFLATVAFARFIMSAGMAEDGVQERVEDGDTPLGMPPRPLRGGRRR